MMSDKEQRANGKNRIDNYNNGLKSVIWTQCHLA